jgi:hypothetical protein
MATFRERPGAAGTHATIFPVSARPTPTGPMSGNRASRNQVPVGWVRLEPEDHSDLAILVELGDDVPDLDQGYGGWTGTPKQRDLALSNWPGYDLKTAPFDLHMDGLEARQPIDGIYDNIEALAGRGRKALPGEPPKLIVDTAGLFRHDVTVFPDARWVIASLAWSNDSDDQATDDNARRLRAACTVVLMQHNDATRLPDRALRAALKHQAKHPPGHKTYTVMPGDTLVSIARRKLGDAGRWRELADLNGVRDPASVKPGAVIHLP